MKIIIVLDIVRKIDFFIVFIFNMPKCQIYGKYGKKFRSIYDFDDIPDNECHCKWIYEYCERHGVIHEFCNGICYGDSDSDNYYSEQKETKIVKPVNNVFNYDFCVSMISMDIYKIGNDNYKFDFISTRNGYLVGLAIGLKDYEYPGLRQRIFDGQNVTVNLNIRDFEFKPEKHLDNYMTTRATIYYQN